MVWLSMSHNDDLDYPAAVRHCIIHVCFIPLASRLSLFQRQTLQFYVHGDLVRVKVGQALADLHKC